MKPERLTIGQLAQQAGVADSTIRYYERAGLIAPDGRTSGNYRYFEATSLERLRFIRAAQASGLSLHDVSTLLAFRDGMVAPCKEVRAVIEARLSDVKRQMRHLRQVQGILEGFRKDCEKGPRNKKCPVLAELGHRRS